MSLISKYLGELLKLVYPNRVGSSMQKTKPCGCPDNSYEPRYNKVEELGDIQEWKEEETEAAIIKIPGSRIEYRCLECGEKFQSMFYRYRSGEEKQIKWKDGYGPEDEQ